MCVCRGLSPGGHDHQERELGDASPSDGVPSRRDGVEVAATVAAMQQQLDAQLALSKTLTESLTGMLDQVSGSAKNASCMVHLTSHTF